MRRFRRGPAPGCGHGPGDWSRGPAATWRGRGGAAKPLPNVVTVTLRQGDARVLEDLLGNWEGRGKAGAVYGVRFTGATERDRLAVDAAATEAPGAARRQAR